MERLALGRRDLELDDIISADDLERQLPADGACVEQSVDLIHISDRLPVHCDDDVAGQQTAALGCLPRLRLHHLYTRVDRPTQPPCEALWQWPHLSGQSEQAAPYTATRHQSANVPAMVLGRPRPRGTLP